MLQLPGQLAGVVDAARRHQWARHGVTFHLLATHTVVPGTN